MTQKYLKRLIEVDLPINRVSAHARREKSLRHGHISTLHTWWARRPLAACRAVICATLWPDPADELCPASFRDKVLAEMLAWTPHERQRLLSEETRRRFEKARQTPGLFSDVEQLRGALLDFLSDFANWNNSTVKEYLDTSRVLTQSAHETLGGAPGTRPLVVDSFAGGGAFPLEAARVGCDTIAYDVNPIPVLINKLMLEYVPNQSGSILSSFDNTAKRVRERAAARLGHLFKSERGQNIAYIWARSVSCEGPSCGLEVPLFTSPWLCERSGRFVWLECSSTATNGKIKVEIKYSRTHPQQSPKTTCRMGSATCPVCGYTTPKKSVYRQLAGKRGGVRSARLLAVVSLDKQSSGRSYVTATEDDLAQAREAEALLGNSGLEHLSAKINPISPGKFGSGLASPTRIGCESFADLFSARQLFVLRTFSDEIASIEEPSLRLLLACALDRLADYNSAHSRWNAPGEKMGNTFGRQAISIVWSFAEVNPFSGATADWDSAIAWIRKVVAHIVSTHLAPGHAELRSATALPLPDDSVASIFTDPPYYGAIMYGDLSDFFYVWLRRTVGQDYSEYFETSLVRKEREIIATPTSQGPDGQDKDFEFFERQMCEAFREARRVTAPFGVLVVVFAHKSTDGWEALLSALVNAGWIVTASWLDAASFQGRCSRRGCDFCLHWSSPGNLLALLPCGEGQRRGRHT